MYSVYVIVDENKKVYKGMTNDLGRRMAEHSRGHTATTRKMKNLKLVYNEDYETFDDARKRELYLKTAAGRRFLKRMVGSEMGN